MPDVIVFNHRPSIIQAVKTLRIRIRDKHAKALDAMACECNMIWNYVNALSFKHTQRTGKFFSAYDMAGYTAGAGKEGLTVHSQTVQGVTEEYVTRRKQFKKARLRWRVSRGARKSLGWIPFKAGAVTFKNGQIKYAGQFFGLWDSYGLAGYRLRSGSFSQDARGRWYANICVETAIPKSAGTASIGIDLGLKDFATLSDGTKVEAQRLYRGAEAKLAVAQRANKKQRVKAIHAQIANRRKDFLHKLSTRLVSQNGAIFVGNVNAAGLAKTRMAKSVLDAGWSTFRTMLQYKCGHAAVWFEEVNESYTTQTCSSCGVIPASSPKGRAGLGIREWTCGDCGSVHDRDTNAAKNILARGHARLAAGIPVL
ncbi:RNA-guided endonuclease InsQ/TnpB family protein [Polaromonas hydrogenivorans]